MDITKRPKDQEINLIDIFRRNFASKPGLFFQSRKYLFLKGVRSIIIFKSKVFILKNSILNNLNIPSLRRENIIRKKFDMNLDEGIIITEKRTFAFSKDHLTVSPFKRKKIDEIIIISSSEDLKEKSNGELLNKREAIQRYFSSEKEKKKKIIDQLIKDIEEEIIPSQRSKKYIELKTKYLQLWIDL